MELVHKLIECVKLTLHLVEHGVHLDSVIRHSVDTLHKTLSEIKTDNNKS